MTRTARSGKGKAKPKKMGRPSLYRPEYCDKLIDWAKQGLGYESFASVPGVSIQTLYDWEKAHPEFLEAKKKAQAHLMAWWERAGIKGEIPTGTWIFNMKNRFGWRDRQPEEVAEEAEAVASRVIARINALAD